MKVILDILLLLLAVALPMVGMGWAVLRVSRARAPEGLGLQLRPRMRARPARWRGRVLRMLILLGLAAACAWLMTGCEMTRKDEGHPALVGVVLGLGVAAFCGLLFFLSRADRSVRAPLDGVDPLAETLPVGLDAAELRRILTACVTQARAVRECVEGAARTLSDDELEEALRAAGDRLSMLIGCLQGLRERVSNTKEGEG